LLNELLGAFLDRVGCLEAVVQRQLGLRRDLVVRRGLGEHVARVQLVDKRIVAKAGQRHVLPKFIIAMRHVPRLLLAVGAGAAATVAGQRITLLPRMMVMRST
jgi:hypothetical protein